MTTLRPEELWAGWRERSEQYLREQGYSSFEAFLRARPDASSNTLASELEIAPIHIDAMIYEGKRGARDIAKEALYRRLLDDPEGWPPPGFRRRKLVRMWIANAIATGGLGRYEEDLFRVEKALDDADLSPGWKPVSVDDEALVNAFEGWPI